MKGIKEYQKAFTMLSELHKNYKKLSRAKVKSLHEKYIELIRSAAYKGNIEAQYELGLNYEDTNYFIPNPMYNQKRRFYWYNKAAAANHPEACNNLAALFEKGEGVKKDLDKALILYKKSYKLGCSYAKDNYKLLEKQIKIN
jgi:TPR repeat protein